MPTLMQSIKRLRDRWLLPPGGTVSVKDLDRRFQPAQPGSLRSLLLKMNTLADEAKPAGGSTEPYYRRSLPKPAKNKGFVRDISLKNLVERLEDQGELVRSETLSVRALIQGFQSDSRESLRSLLSKMLSVLCRYVDLANVQLPEGDPNPVAQAVRLFDARAAEFVWANLMPVHPLADLGTELHEPYPYQTKDGPITVFHPGSKCLAALAYPDFFPDIRANGFRQMVSDEIMKPEVQPGWGGSFGPHFPAVLLLFGFKSEGNYDLTQMNLLPMAYRYYEELDSGAREKLITVLLAKGKIDLVGSSDDIYTSGKVPASWAIAGDAVIPPILPFGIFSGTQRIGETENHILQIHTVRYLTNQLLYQRDQHPDCDNRRNSWADAPSCTELMLRLLRNFLRDDFSEYNAKPYQHETRTALLNLCSYAYDHEVRLGARMVLDYISAHVAVSSCDLRRMVPFRRRNEDDKSKRIVESGFMDVGLLEWNTGCDPNTEHYVVQAGNIRAYETVTPFADTATALSHDDYWNYWRSRPWSILDHGGDGLTEALSDYRLPPSIHDLFVNDLHRRFFQRLHRTPQFVKNWLFSLPDTESGQNCDNMEIYAGSPSYLITAGGSPAGWAIDPGLQGTFKPDDVKVQYGVAVTTSFMPAGQSSGPGTQNYARDLIQFSSFAEVGLVHNYGVAPDFACGHVVHIPAWVNFIEPRGLFSFVDKGNSPGQPGFYLAFCRDGDFTVMEAYDTWLHNPALAFGDFRAGVLDRNRNLTLASGKEAEYITTNGNRVRFMIWNLELPPPFASTVGAQIQSIDYKDVDTDDRIGDASKISGFLNGTILNSTGEAVMEIANPSLQQKIVLDMSDPWHPRRTSETGEVEEAGSNGEVWVNFGWTGPFEGDFFHPFNTLAAAAAAVAEGGVVKIMPGWTDERPYLVGKKRMRLVAPIGGVTIGVR